MNYLLEAFRQSIYAIGNSDPNPPVGAVLVNKNLEIIGRGYTQPYGFSHAEIMAINDAKEKGFSESIKGSTLYVTLEPCSHFGKTPPCTLAIKENLIGKVVIACEDETEKVKGIEELRSAGISVELDNSGLFLEEIRWTLDAFHFAKKHKRPRVILKWAQTMEGYLAPEVGASGPISNPESREAMFRFRKIFHSILVTPGTVISDRPLLNPRYDLQKSLDLASESYINKVLLSFDHNYPQNVQQYNKRFIMLPTPSDKWYESDLNEYIDRQNNLAGEVYFITDDTFQNDFILSMGLNSFYIKDYNQIDIILNYIYAKGALNLMVEAGPTYFEKLIKKKIAEYLFIFKSPHKLWQTGRGFSLSFSAARDNELRMLEAGFSRINEIEFNSDILAIYKKN